MAADQNATTPDPGSPGSALRAFSLDDALTARNGRVLISGTQALVRLALTQARLDRERGLSTAGFVTGYRGSPLAGLDLAHQRIGPFGRGEQTGRFVECEQVFVLEQYRNFPEFPGGRRRQFDGVHDRIFPQRRYGRALIQLTLSAKICR